MEVFLTESPRAELEAANRFWNGSIQFERAARRIIRAAKFGVPECRNPLARSYCPGLVLCSTFLAPSSVFCAVLWVAFLVVCLVACQVFLVPLFTPLPVSFAAFLVLWPASFMSCLKPGSVLD